MFLVVGFMIVGIVSGVPIGFIFGIAGLLLMIVSGNIGSVPWLVPTSLKFMQSYSFLACPLYIIVGTLMLSSSLSTKLFDLLYVILGKSTAFFGGTIVLFIAVFGAISGSAMSAIAAIGPVVIPEGTKYGYDREYTTGLVANAALIAMLIPPSVTMIVFGITAEISIPLLFLATAVPGMLTAVFLIGLNFFLSRRWRFTSVAQPPVSGGRESELFGKAILALPALALPVIILGGIYGGVFTTTEAAAVAVGWIILYKLVATSWLTIKRKSISEFWAGLTTLVRGLIESGRVIGAVCVIIFFIIALSKAMLFVGAPTITKNILIAIVPNKYIFLLLLNVMLLFMGMIMDDMSCCIISAIIFLPVALHFGVSPYHFGAVVGMNVGLGNLTPPVAPNLYFASGIGNISCDLWPPNRYVKTVALFLVLGQLPVLMLITYIPQISLFLPNLWLAVR